MGRNEIDVEIPCDEQGYDQKELLWQNQLHSIFIQCVVYHNSE